MKIGDSYMVRLCRHKWVILSLTALLLVGVEVYYYMRGVPLVDDVIDWLIGMTLAATLIEISFRMTARLQRRLQAEIVERERAEKELEERVAELREALNQIKALKGLIPICASCKKMRDDRGYWHQVEAYLSQHSEVTFSHGLCPDCFKALYPSSARILTWRPTLVKMSIDLLRSPLTSLTMSHYCRNCHCEEHSDSLP